MRATTRNTRAAAPPSAARYTLSPEMRAAFTGGRLLAVREQRLPGDGQLAKGRFVHLHDRVGQGRVIQRRRDRLAVVDAPIDESRERVRLARILLILVHEKERQPADRIGGGGRRIRDREAHVLGEHGSRTLGRRGGGGERGLDEL